MRCWSVAERFYIPELKDFKAIKAAWKKSKEAKEWWHKPVYKVKRQTSLIPLHEGLHFQWRPLERLLSFWRAAMLFYECIIGEWACSLCCGCTPAVSRRPNTNTTLRDKERAATSLWIGHSWDLKSNSLLLDSNHLALNQIKATKWAFQSWWCQNDSKTWFTVCTQFF